MIESDETALAAWLAALLHELVQPMGAAQLSVAQAAEQVERIDRALRKLAQNTDLLRWLVLVLRGDTTASTWISAQVIVDALAAVAPSSTELSVDVPADLAVLSASGALEMVLGNLLANAHKHVIGARVSVRAVSANAEDVPWPPDSPHRLRGRVVLLTIADDGAGIADERRLFMPFAVAGGGIGLWLCRRIVRAHGGDLWHDPSVRGASFTSAWKEAAPQQSNLWPHDPVERGKAIRVARHALGLTRAQLATLSGVADSTIRNIETNRHQPTATILGALTDALAHAAGQVGAPLPDPLDKKGRRR